MKPSAITSDAALLRIPPRPPGSYRRYSRDMVDTIVQIRKLRTLGFSLEEIRMLLQGQAEACRDVRVSIERHIGSTGRKLKELTWRLGCLQRALKEIPCEKDRRCCGNPPIKAVRSEVEFSH